MTKAAARLIPMLQGIAPEAVRRAIRPVPQDGYSAIGPIPGSAATIWPSPIVR